MCVALIETARLGSYGDNQWYLHGTLFMILQKEKETDNLYINLISERDRNFRLFKIFSLI